MKRAVRRLAYNLSKHSALVLVALLLAVAVLIIWFAVTGFSQSATLVTIGIAAISALFASISAFANLLQAAELQSQREKTERPYVNAYFEGESSGMLCFFVQNTGNSPALDLIVRFEPEPLDYAQRPLGQVSLFATPISFLPAGKLIRQLVDMGHIFFAEGKPTQFQVSLTHSSVTGQTFKEKTDFDLAYMRQWTLPHKSAEESLVAMTKEIKRLADLFERTKSWDGNALLVQTPEQDAANIHRSIRSRKETSKWKAQIRTVLERIIARLK
jgi:hypothetical protein